MTITTACDARLPANKILELPASTPDCIVPITIFVPLVEAPNTKQLLPKGEDVSSETHLVHGHEET